jgi:hypothetical protein
MISLSVGFPGFPGADRCAWLSAGCLPAAPPRTNRPGLPLAESLKLLLTIPVPFHVHHLHHHDQARACQAEQHEPGDDQPGHPSPRTHVFDVFRLARHARAWSALARLHAGHAHSPFR